MSSSPSGSSVRSLQFLLSVMRAIVFSTRRVPPSQAWDPQAPPEATREYSHACLASLAAALPNLIGGSADLASSTRVHLDGQGVFSAEHPEGRNLCFGVREHAMAAIWCAARVTGPSVKPLPCAAQCVLTADKTCLEMPACAWLLARPHQCSSQTEALMRLLLAHMHVLSLRSSTHAHCTAVLMEILVQCHSGGCK